MVRYSQEIKDFIFSNYIGTGPQAMAELVNKTFGTNLTKTNIKNFYHNHKLNSGLTGRFEKGHKPFNKGLKGVCAKGCEKTWFTAGHLPHNTKPIGYERITKDGYIEVKIMEQPDRKNNIKNFVPKHRLVWEKANGPIPKGYIVTFKDGDKTNCNINNLALISQAENVTILRRNLRNNNAELTETGILLARAEVTARERKKGRRGVMAEYIERKQAIDFVKKYTPHIAGETTLKCVVGAIKEIPTADVVEVKHGYWKPSPDGVNPIRCSECNMPAPFTAGNNEFGDFEIRRYASSYCHECGAKMDGKDINVPAIDGERSETNG